ncbi:MAG TPA: MarR family transcriptional regulator [Acidimicrobiales bacterium]|jgi:DNA-binding MarR family transcriptional regulator|nr:MarR family transcriptional regulator [Acidimicrobiales bacterium]
MAEDPVVDDVAGALQSSVRLLVQRLRQTQAVEGDLTSSETSALARIDRVGPTTAAELARLERISPQSMGATLGALEERGLVRRAPDPDDGRRLIMSLTDEGQELLRRRRQARNELLSHALADGFTRAELAQLLVAAPLIERLAQSL